MEKFTPRGVAEDPNGQGCPILITVKTDAIRDKLGFPRPLSVRVMASSPFTPAPRRGGQPPRLLRPGLWAFPPNGATHGGQAWLLETTAGDLLIDAPPDTEACAAFLATRASRGPGWLVLLGRDGHGPGRWPWQRLGWPVLAQEQEAYLLPGVERLLTFGEDHAIAVGLHLYWTPGPSPGAAVLHARGGVAGATTDILFCGRLLVPVGSGQLGAVPSPRTFHWPRLRRSVAALPSRLPPGSPTWLASGASAGATGGNGLVENGARWLGELAAACQAQEGIGGLP